MVFKAIQCRCPVKNIHSKFQSFIKEIQAVIYIAKIIIHSKQKLGILVIVIFKNVDTCFKALFRFLRHSTVFVNISHSVICPCYLINILILFIIKQLQNMFIIRHSFIISFKVSTAVCKFSEHITSDKIILSICVY